jgi:D-lactate dehydrogenase
MTVLAYDVYQSKEVLEMGISYVPLEELYAKSDIISIHVPLLPNTHHMVLLPLRACADALRLMQRPYPR